MVADISDRVTRYQKVTELPAPGSSNRAHLSRYRLIYPGAIGKIENGKIVNKNIDPSRFLGFSSGADDDDSEDEESCSMISSIESMKSYAGSGSTSDGIQSMISSTESGVAALGRFSIGTGCGGSISSNTSSTIDVNGAHLAKENLSKEPKFLVDNRSPSFMTAKSNVNAVGRQHIAKTSLTEIRQQHNYYNSMMRPLLSSSKFPVLSPISDKSQEQCPSEVGDAQSQHGSSNANGTGSLNSQSKTPKVSPTCLLYTSDAADE